MLHTDEENKQKKKTKQNKHKQKHTMESIDSVYLDLLVAIWPCQLNKGKQEQLSKDSQWINPG